jgi:hypothetical protein
VQETCCTVIAMFLHQAVVSYSPPIEPAQRHLYSHMDLITVLRIYVGGHTSVGIAARYGLDGPGIESVCGLDFPHPSRTAVGPTQPPIKWVPGLSRG